MVKLRGMFLLIMISIALISCTHQQTKSTEVVTTEAEQQTDETGNTTQNGDETTSSVPTPDLSDANVEEMVNGESAALAALEDSDATKGGSSNTEANLSNDVNQGTALYGQASSQRVTKMKKSGTRNVSGRSNETMIEYPKNSTQENQTDMGNQINVAPGATAIIPIEGGEVKSPGNIPKTDPFGMGEEDEPRAEADANKAHLASGEITQFIAHHRFVLVLIGFAILGVSWAAMRPRKKTLGGMLRPLDRD